MTAEAVVLYENIVVLDTQESKSPPSIKSLGKILYIVSNLFC